MRHLLLSLLIASLTTAAGFTRLDYNNPNLVVDLGVGLWGTPLLTDIDADGKPDLLINSSGPEYSGIYLFKRTSDTDPFAPLQPSQFLSKGSRAAAVSNTPAGPIIATPGKIITNFPGTFFAKSKKIPYTPDFFLGPNSNWQYLDLDNDGALDLLIAVEDTRSYAWVRMQGASKKTFDSKGNFLHGAPRGYIYFIKNTGTSSNPDYAKSQRIYAGDLPLETYGRSSPCYADFDGDGLIDIITGSTTDHLTFFKNTGTSTAPRFAEGRQLPHRMDLCMISPVVTDWNNDGHPDLLVGEEDGRAAVLIHLGTTTNGVPNFAPPRYLQQYAREVKTGVLNIPHAVDWNNDGLTDLLLGNSSGYIVYLQNLGGFPPKWAAPVNLQANGKTIRILAGENGSIQGPGEAKWGYTNLTTLDYNNDGLPDILINSIWGLPLLYLNTGTPTAPQLADPIPLTVQSPTNTGTSSNNQHLSPERASDVPQTSKSATALRAAPPSHQSNTTPSDSDSALQPFSPSVLSPPPPWTWWKPKPNTLTTQWRASIQAIDINNDKTPDIVCLDRDGFLVAYFGKRAPDGNLTLQPPQRIFRVAPGNPSAFDHAHKPVEIPNPKFPKLNALADIDPDGNLSFFGWDPETDDGPRGDYVITATLYRGKNPDTPALQKQGAPLRLNAGWAGRSGRRKFVLTDWNGDGKLDLLVNSTNINFFENIATTPGEFILVDRGPLDTLKLAGHTVGPAIVDWNKDNIPDLVVGTETGCLFYLPNPRTKK